MKIENKEMLLYSIDKAYDELVEALKRADEKEVYFRLGSCLHWIIDCYDRVKGTEIEKQNEEMFRAVKGANNAQKHIRQLYKLHEEKTSNYPKKYPKHYGVKYLWRDIEKIPLRNEKEKIAYQKLFCGNSILIGLLEAKETTHRYYERCD